MFGDEDYRNLFVNMQGGQLCVYHLSHGAQADDYEWSERLWNFWCKPCDKNATPEHCATKRHINNIQYWGVASTCGSNKDIKAGEGANKQIVMYHRPSKLPIYCLDHRELPEMYKYSPEKWTWDCLLCQSVATEDLSLIHI